MLADLERFLALVCRELAADEARVLERDEDSPADPRELRCRMSEGRSVVVRFVVPPFDMTAKQRRLELLVGTFDSVVEEAAPGRPPRPPVSRSLRGELEALRERCVAANAIVIDAQSPVVWGAARPEGVLPPPPAGSSPRISELPAPPSEGDDPARPEPPDGPTAGSRDTDVGVLSRRALEEVRALSDIGALRKGKHVRHVESGAATPYVVHSFAGIYLLFLVFDGAFDELRAERAILEALPRIERLVMALPPLDPAPQAGVVALRRPRRR